MNRFDERCPPIRSVATVLENRDEGGANRRLRLDVEGWLGFWPGQFAMLSPVAPGDVPRSDPLLPRPMAIFRQQARAGVDEVEILYRIVGRGTRLMGELRAGDRLGFVGPLGLGFALPEPAPHCILVGGGSGIASLYGLAEQLSSRAAPASTTVILGARSQVDLLGAGDFAALGVDLKLATEDGSRGSRGLVTDLLAPAIADGTAGTVVYACGPTPMMHACSELAAASRVRCVVSLENNMACGFGACLGCAVPLSEGGFGLVCRDGPVFDAPDVAWGGLA